MAHLRPPFTLETATEKVKFAQGMWNTRDPERVSRGYTPDCTWRNRGSFIKGTSEIIDFLTAKWTREHSYRLRKELFAFTDDKIAVQFWYNWTFDRETGRMRKRQMSGNDVVLGRNGDGVAVPEEGIFGRWYVDGVDVDDESVTKKMTEAHW